MSARQTPSQTVGPFYAMGLTSGEDGYDYPDIIGSCTFADTEQSGWIQIVGWVFDGDGQPIADALIEAWQADRRGRYRQAAHGASVNSPDSDFIGFARSGTSASADRSFSIRTLKPGPLQDGQAPHVVLTLFMRGGLNHLYTRLYFDDEAAANATDPILAALPAARRDTLIAHVDTATEPSTYRFDIHMQGARETVFFDV